MTQLRLYHGGALQASGTRLWATAEHDYAAAYAQLHDAELWAFDVDLPDGEVLDLTVCGGDPRAVAAALSEAGIPTEHQADDTQPANVLRRVSDAAILAAGYRAVRVWEWIDWKTGVGEQRVVSFCIIDMSVIVKRQSVALSDRNVRMSATDSAASRS